MSKKDVCLNVIYGLLVLEELEDATLAVEGRAGVAVDALGKGKVKNHFCLCFFVKSC